MSVTSYITGPARRIALGSTVALIAIGVVACSSATAPTHTSTAPTSIPMPDLVGQYWLNAKPKLDSLGWKGVLVKGPDVPANPQQRYRIVVQSPAPGEQLDPDSPITLEFGV
jgi:eukaryotic-like serine/threonine-protein kinase